MCGHLKQVGKRVPEKMTVMCREGERESHMDLGRDRSIQKHTKACWERGSQLHVDMAGARGKSSWGQTRPNPAQEQGFLPCRQEATGRF